MQGVRQSPPYDFTWTSGSGQGGESATTEGNIELNTQGIGGEQNVGGGIGFWFPAAAGGARRFSTTCRFSFEWSESASFMLLTITAAYGSRCGVCPRTVGSVRAAISFPLGWTTSVGMNSIIIAVVAKRLRSCFSTPSPMVCMRAGSMLRSVAMRITVPLVLRFQLPVCTLLWRRYTSNKLYFPFQRKCCWAPPLLRASAWPLGNATSIGSSGNRLTTSPSGSATVVRMKATSIRSFRRCSMSSLPSLSSSRKAESFPKCANHTWHKRMRRTSCQEHSLCRATAPSSRHRSGLQHR